MTVLFHLWIPRTGFDFISSLDYHLDIWVPLFSYARPQTLRLSAITHIPDLAANPYIDWADTLQPSRTVAVPDLSRFEQWTAADCLGFQDLRNLIKEDGSDGIRHSLALQVGFHTDVLEDIVRSESARNPRKLVSYMGNVDLATVANCFRVPELDAQGNLTWSRFRLRPNMNYALVKDLRFGLLDLDSWSPEGLKSLRQTVSTGSAPLWA